MVKSDNDEERFARIEALMEEYRTKHEDLQRYVEEACVRAQDRLRNTTRLATRVHQRVRSRRKG
jgi:hypothetical protein